MRSELREPSTDQQSFCGSRPDNDDVPVIPAATGISSRQAPPWPGILFLTLGLLVTVVWLGFLGWSAYIMTQWALG